MTGPYVAEIFLGPSRDRAAAPDVVVSFEEMYYADGTGETRVRDPKFGFETKPISSAAKKVYRYYRNGPDATLIGTTRLAAFYVAELLEPGEEASVSIVGRIASGPYASDHAVAGSVGVRRDAAGRVFLSLGSRGGVERHFVGAER